MERNLKIKALAKRLFGLKDRATKPQRLMAAAVAETVLRDLVAQYHKAAAKVGSGVLVVRLDDDGETTQWASGDQIRANLAVAEEFSDEPMVTLHRAMLKHLDQLDEDHHEALLLLIENRSACSDMRLFVLNDTEMPERLRALLTEWGR